MKAIMIKHHGNPDVLQLVEVPVPAPGDSQVLVRHMAIGVNFVDLQHRTGSPYAIGLPLIPGVEAAGIVVQVGAHVTEFKVGDRVAYAGYMSGVYAEYGVVPAARLVPVPDNVDLPLAAAALMQGMTAYMLTHAVYRVQPGDFVFIPAAASGVGLYLIQMAKWNGATVMGTVSSIAKAELARKVGADHMLCYGQGNILASIRALMGDQGAHVVYDGVGQATFDLSLALLRPAGTLAVFGLASGAVPAFDINRLSGITGANSKGSLFLTWPTLNDYTAQRKHLLQYAGAVLGALREGRLQTTIADVLPLAEAAQGHRLLEHRQVVGKIVLVP